MVGLLVLALTVMTAMQPYFCGLTVRFRQLYALVVVLFHTVVPTVLKSAGDFVNRREVEPDLLCYIKRVSTGPGLHSILLLSDHVCMA